MKILQQIWDDLKHGENIDLYIAVVSAIGLAALNLFGIAPPLLIAPITLAVLGLIAISNLVTRHQIEEQLQNLAKASNVFLKGRSELPSFDERGGASSEIIIVGISLITAIVPHLNFFEQKMKEGCNLRFLLLDPKSSSLDTWNKLSKIQDVQIDIEQVLKMLKILKELEQTSKGKCEVRLANVFLPFGVAAFDPNKETGTMNVEMLPYKRTVGERPHFTLNRAKDNKWFEYFKGQYEQLWADSTPWRLETN